MGRERATAVGISGELCCVYRVVESTRQNHGFGFTARRSLDARVLHAEEENFRDVGVL